MTKFNGKIALDIRDSTPDWASVTPPAPPKGAPNVLIVLYDDTGQAAWSPYGGRINMPTMDKLAANGLTYTQWHTTALCSPTRSCFLTGRNHHQNGFAQISEGMQGFPGYSTHIPPENATMATVLRDAGWGTYWVGKNHNIPLDEWDAGGSKKHWPLAQGFDRFYGFVGGETNEWYPSLAEDNHYIEQPYMPEDGYHLSKDLADQALRMLRDSKQTKPDKPWFMWFCPGANHAPHHAPKEYIDKYKGAFDDGYEAYREWVLPRMIERGILPEGTEMTELNPMTEGTFTPADLVKPWDSLTKDEKKLFAHMAEVYAGMSEYTDSQVGRIIDYLEESGQLDNTIVLYCADNGASGEGSPNGSVNEGKFFNGVEDKMEDNLAMMDKLGSPDTYNHYPTGWASAFSTPYRMFKRYTYQGGISDPLVIHWPAGIKAKGETRSQYHHATDIVPTILECLGVEMPKEVDGVKQTPLPGVSMKYSFDKAATPTTKQVQYYEMLGSRGIWRDGWKAVAEHGPISGIGHFDKDKWQLFHTDVDRSETHDLSDEMPDKAKEMADLWLEEAKKYNVLPLNDMTALELFSTPGLIFRAPIPESGEYTYYPDTSPIPENSAANTHGVSYKILAEVDFTSKTGGILMAQGSRFGGHALFIKNGSLMYVYNFLGIPPETKFEASAPKAGRHVVGFEFVKDTIDEMTKQAHGTGKLYIDDEVVAEAPLVTTPGSYALCGEGLCVGYDSSDYVTKEYSDDPNFHDGKLHKVVINIAQDAYVDVERQFAAAMARD